ncbi:MAG: hypothetical protein U1D06_13740, partial [Paracoccaceae bacterium]|nr:hypothetical protein [Paracoccaceae bacterium]
MMMKTTCLVGALMLLAADGALAQSTPEEAATSVAAPSGPERRFTAQDLFDLSMASDPQISPDGSRIAYVRVSNDI